MHNNTPNSTFPSPNPAVDKSQSTPTNERPIAQVGPSPKKIRYLLFLLIAVGLAMTGLMITNASGDAAEQLESLWQDDFQNLQKAKKIPRYWDKIRSIDKVAANGDALAAQWSKSVAAPIKINRDGEYRLEILFISQVDGEQLRAVIQHHLVHLPTGNSVWELGRTYELK